MQNFASLLGVIAALTVGVVSPGPSFVMVARTAVAASRSEGLAAAMGMGAGGAFFATAALLGLQGVLLAVPSLYADLKGAGGLYLVYLGVQIWRGAAKPLLISGTARPEATGTGTWRGVLRGFTTQVSNPKTAVVYASVFAAFLPEKQSLGFAIALVAAVCAVESGWYALVALALSSERPRSVYLRYKSWIDRAAGTVMVALGLKLVSSVRG